MGLWPQVQATGFLLRLVTVVVAPLLVHTVIDHMDFDSCFITYPCTDCSLPSSFKNCFMFIQNGSHSEDSLFSQIPKILLVASQSWRLPLLWPDWLTPFPLLTDCPLCLQRPSSTRASTPVADVIDLTGIHLRPVPGCLRCAGGPPCNKQHSLPHGPCQLGGESLVARCFQRAYNSAYHALETWKQLRWVKITF